MYVSELDFSTHVLISKIYESLIKKLDLRLTSRIEEQRNHATFISFRLTSY